MKVKKVELFILFDQIWNKKIEQKEKSLEKSLIFCSSGDARSKNEKTEMSYDANVPHSFVFNDSCPYEKGLLTGPRGEGTTRHLVSKRGTWV